MVQRMKKISLKGSREELRGMIDTLKATGTFELSSLRRARRELTETETERIETLNAKIARVKSVIEFAKKARAQFAAEAKKYNKSTSLSSEILSGVDLKNEFKRNTALFSDIDEIEYSDLKNIATHEGLAMDLVQQLEDLSAKINEIRANIAKDNAAVKDLIPYINMDVNFNAMRDTREAFIIAGIMPIVQLAKFKSDFDLDGIVIQEYPSDKKSVALVIIGHNDDYPVINMIYDYQFEKCKLGFNVTAREKVKLIEEQNAGESYEVLALLQKACLSADDIKLLKYYYDYLNNELDTENILASTIVTKNSYVLNGWIPDGKKKIIVDLLRNADKDVKIKLDDATEIDTPPVIVRSSRVVDPYQSITGLYGQPARNDIDPNPWVAFFYFLFFGVMIGDIGYGIIMILAAVLVITCFKPKKGFKDLVLIIGMGGLSAMLWGVLFGSIFGAEASEIFSFMPKRVIDPMNDAILFLGLSLALGVLHIVVGLALKFYNLLRQGRVMDAICDALFRIIMFFGIIIFVIGMLVEGFAYGNIGLYIAIGSLALIVLTAGRKSPGVFGKMAGGFGGAYSLVNYFSDILSYARLFGLGLVGAVIAMVANLLGGMLAGIPGIGAVLGVIVALFFHVFNLAIGLLSAYVHNARLQFIEFFGKFYEGSGKTFVAMGSNLSYTKIKSVLATVTEPKYNSNK